MTEDFKRKEIISQKRDFTKGYRQNDPYRSPFVSDQTQKIPSPARVKESVTDKNDWVYLTRDFSNLSIRNNLTDVFRDRHSCRIFTDEPITAEQLSFLLWATQGVKKVRAKSGQTVRTVPSAGGRHEFETYLILRNVEGLRPGAYHYLPVEHAVEFLHEIEDAETRIADSLFHQTWCGKAAAVFYWAMIPYRAEWRYSIYAHRMALMDAGHICQNLYIASTGLSLGCCAVASLEHEQCCEIFSLDGVEEYIVYAAPVGNIRDEDKKSEPMFHFE